jgi:hypothetical protein
LSTGLLWAGNALGRRLPQPILSALAAASVVLLFCFALFLHGRLVLAQILPISNVVVLGNWMPLLASCAAGAIAAMSAIPPWRRHALGLLLVGATWYSVFSVVLAPAPALGAPQFLRGFCIQTSASSCSPCCAVALLREHGIRTSEAEMVSLCMTGTGGTPELGLYRGLRRKVRDTTWAVQIVQGDVERLRQPEPWPLLLLVESPTPNSPAPRAWWKRGRIADHAVVFYGFTEDGSADIGDPVAGRTTWTAEELQDRWCGSGLRLVPRTTAQPTPKRP